MIVPMQTILTDARRNSYAIGAFNVGNYETLRAVVLAAETLQLPVIIQFYQRLVLSGHGKPLVAAARAMCEESSVPVALHLDHGSSVEVVMQAIAAGCSSVMIDGSNLPYHDNVALVREAVKIARREAVAIEAEIGHVPMGGDVLQRSDAEEAVEFWRATDVDALAVSIGTAHGFYTAEPKIDVELCRQIAEQVPIPLVLHGGSGTPPEKIHAVIACGIAKVNIATEYQNFYQQRLRRRLEECGDKFYPADLLNEPVVTSLVEFVKGYMLFLAQKSSALEVNYD